MGFNVGGAAGKIGGQVSDFTKSGGGKVSDFTKSGIDKIGGGLSNLAEQAGLGKFQAEKYDPNAAAFSDQESKARQAEFARQLQESQGRKTNLDTSGQNEWRRNQLYLTSQLQDQAAGQGPSLAQSQLQQATNRNIAQAMALAASQRGQTAGQGLRNIGMTTAAANQQAAQQAADLRMQEQMAARQQLAGVIGQGRSADINVAQNQADVALQQQALNDAQARFYNQGMMQMTDSDRASRIALEQMKAQQYLGAMGANQAGYDAFAQRRGGFLGGIGQGLASAFSDEELKTDIEDGELSLSGVLKDVSTSLKKTSELSQVGGQKQQPTGHEKMGGAVAEGIGALFSDKNTKKGVDQGDAKVQGFLDSLKAYQYKYKNPEHGSGTYVSPMAQDLEKSELGKSMVIDTPEGKMVDYARGAGTMLAAAAMLNDKVQSIESQLATVFKNKKSGKKG